MRGSRPSTAPVTPTETRRRMVYKLLLVALVGLIVGSPAVSIAQTPYTTAAVAAKDGSEVGTTAASAANAWLGAQLGYKFGQNNEDLGDNLLVAASVIYQIPLTSSGGLRLPVISNFADIVAAAGGETPEEEAENKLKELLFASSGVRAGLYPYWPVPRTPSDFKVILHGEGSWKLNGFKEEGTDTVNYLNQFRVGGGIELAVGDTTGGAKPLTLSITPIWTRFSRDEYDKVFDDGKSSRGSLELVGVLPLSGRTGLLFEFVRGDVNSFRAGVVIAAEK